MPKQQKALVSEREQTSLAIMTNLRCQVTWQTSHHSHLVALLLIVADTDQLCSEFPVHAMKRSSLVGAPLAGDSVFPGHLKRAVSVNESASVLLFNNFVVPEFAPSKAVTEVPTICVSPETSLGMFKSSVCNVLPGSFLEVNTLFGMENDRNSHLKRVDDYCNSMNCAVRDVLEEQSCELVPSEVIEFVNKRLVFKGEELECPASQWVTCGDLIVRDCEAGLEVKAVRKCTASVTLQADTVVRVVSDGHRFHRLRVVSNGFVSDSDISCDYLEVVGPECSFSGKYDVETVVLRCEDCRVSGGWNVSKMMLIMLMTTK